MAAALASCESGLDASHLLGDPGWHQRIAVPCDDQRGHVDGGEHLDGVVLDEGAEVLQKGVEVELPGRPADMPEMFGAELGR